MGLFTRLGLAAALLAATAAEPASPVASLLTDPVAAAAYDYPALRDRLGLAQFAKLSEDTTKAVQARAAGRAYPCWTVAETYVLTGLGTTLLASDARTWRSDREAAAKAIEQSRAERARLKTSMSGTGPVEYYLGAAAGTADPRLKALFQRMADDQAVRLSRGPTATLSADADQTAGPVITAEGCAIDGDNVAWLKREIAAHGWFDTARHGEPAATAAFLIVQHADQDRAFQKHALSMMAADTAPRARLNVAYLTDRIASDDQQPQTYGTQGRCVGPHAWEPNPIKDPETLEARRAAVGLPPMATYRQLVAPACVK